jgi:hypothetical protein
VQAQGAGIVGTWLLTSPGPSTRLVQTYTADGNLISIHDEHSSRNTQFGSWVQTVERQFRMRNVAFRFDAAGEIVATIDVRGVYTVDPAGDTMSGRGVRFELDPNGSPIGAAVPWESRAVRLVPVPLDGAAAAASPASPIPTARGAP